MTSCTRATDAEDKNNLFTRPSGAATLREHHMLQPRIDCPTDILSLCRHILKKYNLIDWTDEGLKLSLYIFPTLAHSTCLCIYIYTDIHTHTYTTKTKTKTFNKMYSSTAVKGNQNKKENVAASSARETIKRMCSVLSLLLCSVMFQQLFE